MPLIVWVVNETGLPLKVMVLNVPVGPVMGSIASRLRAPVPCKMLKVSVFPAHAREPKEEELRPSSQVNICSAETIGTP